MRFYLVRRAPIAPALDSEWSDAAWKSIPIAKVNWFHPDSPHIHPRTQVKLMAGPKGLHLFFRVEDRHVIARCTRYQQSVCKDSCVEFFVEPDGARGYFNFEFNAGGTLLLYHITTPATGSETGARVRTAVSKALGSTVKVHTSFNAPIRNAIPGPVVWFLQAFIPFALFEACIGRIRPLAGKTWRGNFYKCGSDFPHYACWSPVKVLSFHQPKHFAPLVFEK